MRAVNLMPESGRTSASSPAVLLAPSSGVIALLVVALGLVTLYVVSSNSVSSGRAKLATVQQEAQAAQAQASRLANYVNYQKLAEQRAATVKQIASGRFDWHAALANLSQVVPANAAFQSLLATAAPGSSVSGAGGSVGAGTSGLRSDIASPAFEVKGCTASQDDVARLLSRLRVMPGVQRVTLADSVKNSSTAPSGSAPSGNGNGSATPTACGTNPATFDLVVFFAPVAGAATGVAGTPGASPVTTPAGAASTASSVATTTTTTTAAATATGGQPVGTGG